jgi:hypothetical protein
MNQATTSRREHTCARHCVTRQRHRGSTSIATARDNTHTRCHTTLFATTIPAITSTATCLAAIVQRCIFHAVALPRLELVQHGQNVGKQRVAAGGAAGVEVAEGVDAALLVQRLDDALRVLVRVQVVAVGGAEQGGGDEGDQVGGDDRDDAGNAEAHGAVGARCGDFDQAQQHEALGDEEEGEAEGAEHGHADDERGVIVYH